MHLDMEFKLDYLNEESISFMEFSNGTIVPSFSFVKLKDSKHFSLAPIMQAIYFADALKIK